MASIVVVSAVVLTAFYPALTTGFVRDDWWFIRAFLTQPLSEYLASALDPRGQYIWYRPMGLTLWMFQYALFGTNPLGYHLAQILIHLGNSLLVLGLVSRVTHSIRTGLVSSLVYAIMTYALEAIVSPSDSQVPATLFFLLSIWFWFSYLQTESRGGYFLGVFLALLAMLTKATSITLPFVLFLADRRLVAKPVTLGRLIQRYLPFALPVPLYLISMYPYFPYSIFSGELGFGPKLRSLSNLIEYLAVMSFPWSTIPCITYLWLPTAIILFLAITIRRQSRGLTFLGLVIPFILIPWLFLPWSAARYLYSPLIVTAILVGLGFNVARSTIHLPWFRPILTLSLSILVFWSATRVWEFSQYWGEVSRLERLVFRNIAQRHPAFPEGTFLYFINGTDIAWSTMAVMRYGKSVSVSDIYTPREARLRDHSHPLVIYLDDKGEPREIAVDMQVSTRTIPPLPVEFQESILLVNYELTSERVKRGEMLGLILYWRAMKKLDKDYTVFVHMLDDNGQIIEGFDGQPREGKSPTSAWRGGELVPDGRVLTIPEDAPPGNNIRLQIGLYHLPTMQRLLIVNSEGEPIGDHLTIGPLSIEE